MILSGIKKRLILLGVAAVIFTGGALSIGLTSYFRVQVKTIDSGSTRVPAKQADAFVDSIGVNIHLGYTDGIYKNYQEIVKPRLRELGVRHVRDGLEPKRSDSAIKLKDLYHSLGIKSLLIINPDRHSPVEGKDFVKSVIGSEKVVAIEGMNEPNNFIGGCCWAAATRNFQRQTFETFKNDRATANLPFVAPSLVAQDADGKYARELGDLRAFSDFGNIHNYYGGRNPETNGWGDNGYGSLDWHLNLVSPPVSGNKPLWATETGYHNARTTTSGHKYTPEDVAARYLPRLYLHHFNRGIVKSYVYELLDEGTDLSNVEHNFGLLRHDNTPKPSFDALKNLIALLKDPGPSFAPGALDYTLSGRVTDVYQVLLQKRSGAFYLIMWIGAQRWDMDGKKETEIANQNVVLKLNSRIEFANIYLPLNGTNIVKSYQKPVLLTLSVPDHPLVVELKTSGDLRGRE